MKKAFLNDTSPFFDEVFREELAEKMKRAVLNDTSPLAEGMSKAVLEENVRLAERSTNLMGFGGLITNAILEDARLEREAKDIRKENVRLAERRAYHLRGYIPAFEDSCRTEPPLVEEILAEGESKDCMAIAVSPHLFTFFEDNDMSKLRAEVGNSPLYIRSPNSLE